MTCKQVRAELVECWGNTEQLGAETVAHLEACVECRREAGLMRETHAMVDALPRERAPDGFTARVLEELAREDAQPGWSERIAALLVPERRPSWARAAAVGAAIALAAAGGAVWMSHDTAPEAEPQIAARAAVTQTASPSVEPVAYETELEELRARHQSMEMTQPLADDAGVSFVLYESN